MSKNKKILKESTPGYDDRKFGDPLPTLASIARKYNERKGTVNEKKDLGGAYIESIRMLTAGNHHTRARTELARQIGDKRLIKAYEGLQYIEDILRTKEKLLRTQMDKILFAASKKKFTNHDIVMDQF